MRALWPEFLLRSQLIFNARHLKTVAWHVIMRAVLSAGNPLTTSAPTTTTTLCNQSECKA